MAVSAPPIIVDLTAGGTYSGYYVPASPIAGSPRGGKITGIVFHHTGGSGLSGALETAKGGTGATYYIDRNGTIVRYAPDTARVVGIRDPGSQYRTDAEAATAALANGNVINIEIVASDSEHYTEAQQEAAIALGTYLSETYSIPSSMIVGHGEIQNAELGGNKMPSEGVSVADLVRKNVDGVLPPANIPGVATSLSTVPGVTRNEARAEALMGTLPPTVPTPAPLPSFRAMPPLPRPRPDPAALTAAERLQAIHDAEDARQTALIPYQPAPDPEPIQVADDLDAWLHGRSPPAPDPALKPLDYDYWPGMTEQTASEFYAEVGQPRKIPTELTSPVPAANQNVPLTFDPTTKQTIADALVGTVREEAKKPTPVSSYTPTRAAPRSTPEPETPEWDSWEQTLPSQKRLEVAKSTASLAPTMAETRAEQAQMREAAKPVVVPGFSYAGTERYINPAYAAWEKQMAAYDAAAANKSYIPYTGYGDPGGLTKGSAPPPPPPKYITRSVKVNTGAIGGESYVIAYGDTLSAISRRSGVSIAELQRINGITDPNRINAGATIRISSAPAKTTSTTKTTTPASTTKSTGYGTPGHIATPAEAAAYQRRLAMWS